MMEIGTDAQGPYVKGLGQVFRTKPELKRLGYVFAFKYGSAGLAAAMTHLANVSICTNCSGNGIITSDEPVMQMATSKCRDCSGLGRVWTWLLS